MIGGFFSFYAAALQRFIISKCLRPVKAAMRKDQLCSQENWATERSRLYMATILSNLEVELLRRAGTSLFRDFTVDLENDSNLDATAFRLRRPVPNGVAG